MRMYMGNIAAGENKTDTLYFVNSLHGPGKPLSKLHHAGSEVRREIVEIGMMRAWDKLHMPWSYGIDIQESQKVMIFLPDMRRSLPGCNCAKQACADGGFFFEI